MMLGEKLLDADGNPMKEGFYEFVGDGEVVQIEEGNAGCFVAVDSRGNVKAIRNGLFPSNQYKPVSRERYDECESRLALIMN